VASNIAEILRKKGYDIDVYNPRFISPISNKSILELEKYQKIFTLENHVVLGGFGSLLKSRLFKPEVHSFGLPNNFIEHGSIGELREEIGFTQDRILLEIERIISE
jgi:1-deoxy-D-xylulose-5-phosphate synthase